MTTAFSHGNLLESSHSRDDVITKKIFRLTSDKNSASILGLYPMVGP